MNSLILFSLLALSAPVLFGQSPGTFPAENVIAIYTQFDQSPSGLTVEHMKNELESIMAPLALQFRWRPLEAANGREAMAQIVVVRFNGKCQVDALTHPLQDSGVLGWTHISNHEVLPFSHVDCDKIREIVFPSPRLAVESEPELLLGRAMGRVLAHELYHFFANTTRHAASGVAKARISRAELISEHMAFEENELRRLRSGVLKSLLGLIQLAGAPAGGG